VGELIPLRRGRFVRSDTLVELFRDAPRVDYERFRADVDHVLDQDATPRG
jgi:hypothetical protein